MKLYTEEQVRQIINFYESKISPNTVFGDADDTLSYFKPIELPTDEEIETHSYIIADNFENPNDTNYNGLRLGAVRMSWWLMDKIKGDKK